MEFKTFDLMTKVVPGILVMLGAFIFSSTFIEYNNEFLKTISGFSSILLVIFLAISYLIGYLNEAVSSIVEDKIEPLMRHPSHILLSSGKSLNRILISEPSEVRKSLFDFLEIKDSSNQQEGDISENETHKAKQNRQVYRAAKNYLNIHSEGRLKERLDEFNNSYIFSRNVVASFLVFGILVIISFIKLKMSIQYTIITSIIFIGLMILLYSRYRLRHFIYVREVLVGTNNHKKKHD